jgi:FkbM family methyltransferase
VSTASRARRVAETIAARIIVKRHLPKAFDRAAFYASGTAGLKFLVRSTRAMDVELLRNARETISDANIVWDVGANVGMFSAAVLAGRNGQVVAFEPDCFLATLLRRTASIQPPRYAPIKIVPIAIGASVGLRSFSIAARGRASNSLSEYGLSETGGVKEIQLVPSFSLDSLELPRPDEVKNDVEGAELEVLRGARSLLDEARPTVLCEVAPAVRDDVSQVFRETNYAMFPGLKPRREWSRLEKASWDTIAIPIERAPK